MDGVVNGFARERPCLKPDAVPTVFDDYLRHLHPKKTAKRKVRNLCDQPPTKRQKRDAGADVSNVLSSKPTMYLRSHHQQSSRVTTHPYSSSHAALKLAGPISRSARQPKNRPNSALHASPSGAACGHTLPSERLAGQLCLRRPLG